MFCSQCGEKIPENSNFCIICGAQISADNPHNPVDKESPVKVHSQPNVPLTQSNNRKKLGIIAVIVALPIIGVIAFFTLRSGAEGEHILADTTTVAYSAQVEAPAITPESPMVTPPTTPTSTDDDGNWVTLEHRDDYFDIGLFNIDIPESFAVVDTSRNGFTLYRNGLTMFVNEFRRLDDHWEWLVYGVHENQFGEAVNRQAFVFNDGREGFLVEGDDFITFLDYSFFLRVNFDGNRSIFADNEDIILQIARSLTPASITSQPAEESWLDIDMWSGFATISIPHAWYYSFEEQGPFTFWNITGIGARGATVNMTVWESTLGDLNMHLDNARYSQFVFNDMHNGYMFEFPDVPDWDTNISWLRMDSGILVSLNHDGDRSIFTDNEDIILRIARSLTTPSTHTYFPEVATHNNAMDSALVGGRWLADTGAGFEFLGNGTGMTNYRLFWWNTPETEFTWSANNGILEITGYHTETYTYLLEDNVVLNRAFDIYGDRLVLQDSAQFNRELGNSGITGGTWHNPTNNVSLEFFSDGVGRRRWTYGGWTYFTWFVQDGLLIRTYTAEASFNYVIEGSQLSVFMDVGRVFHTRIGGN